MGLDWMLKDKPVEGKEDRVAEIREELEDIDQDSDRAVTLKAELDSITVSAPETLGAPRVGIDANATEWFRGVYERNHKEVVEATPEERKRGNQGFYEFWSKPFEECLEAEKGKFVIDLTDYKLSTVTGMVGPPTSFRGKCIGYAECISEELQGEAYEDHDPDEMIDYSIRLFAAVAEYLKEKLPEHFADVDEETLIELNDGLRHEAHEVWLAATKGKTETAEQWIASNDAMQKWESSLPPEKKLISACSDVIDGARWLRFWGEKGHGYWAWS